MTKVEPEVDPTKIHPELTANFAVFRRPQTKRDVADGVRASPPMVKRLGLLPAEVRVVSVSSTELAWVTPGSRGAALTQRSVDSDGAQFGTWGGRVGVVSARGLFGWKQSVEGQETVYGLVPDGNTTVTLHLLDGAELSLPVIENVFIATASGPAYSLEFLDSQGRRDRRQWREPS